MYSDSEQQSQFIQSAKGSTAKYDRSVDLVSIIGARK